MEKYSIFQEKRNLKKSVGAPIQKYSENVFAHSWVAEHSEIFLFFHYTNLHFLSTRVLPPPPLNGLVRKECKFFLTASLCYTI